MGLKFLSFLMFSCFGMNVAFCNTEAKDARLKCFKKASTKSSESQNCYFQEKTMSDGLVCIYNAKAKPSECDTCKKKKKGG